MSPADRSGHQVQVDVDRFSIRVRIAGDGPPVVVIHGAGGISDAPGLAALTTKFTTYALEVPGFGTSPCNTTSTSFRELAATLSAATRQLGVGPHSVIGTSVGARLALWHAVDDADQVEALVLVSPASILPDGVRLPTIQPCDLLDNVSRVTSSQRRCEDELLERAFGHGRDPALEAAMGDLQTPTLILFGDEDDHLPAEVGRIYRNLLPNSFNILVHKAGPLIAHERPEAFASVVTDFLQYRESFVHSHQSGVLFP